MSFVNNCAIIDSHVYLPEKIVTNEELCKKIDSTDEWIRRRMGVTERRYGNSVETVVYMASHAAAPLVVNPSFTESSSRAIIVSSVTQDTITPSTASFVCETLGLQNVAAFDMQAACAGFPYGLELARSLIVSGSFDSIIVVASDKLSDWTDPFDRSVPLIGDGAGAVLVSKSDVSKISKAFLGSDSKYTSLISTDSTFSTIRNRNNKYSTSENTTNNENVSRNKLPTIIMDGPSVFRWTLSQMPSIIDKILSKAGYEAKEIDVFIPHQANIRIIEALVKNCGFRDDVIVADSIRYYGNTLSASIPIAFSELSKSGVLKKNDKVLLAGFGSGMIFGGQVVTI